MPKIDKYQGLVRDIERWHVKLEKADKALKRATQMLIALERKRRRMSAATMPKADAVERAEPPKVVEPAPVKADDDLAIPGFLKREPAPFNRFEAEHKQQKQVKSRARIAKMKASLSGDTKKMPLQGKAALAAINE